MNILRELREKIAAASDALTLGLAADYPAYRELVGRIKALRELEDWYKDQLAQAQNNEGDTVQ